MSEVVSWPVTWIEVTSYHDQPLEGWLRFGPRNRYHPFRLAMSGVGIASGWGKTDVYLVYEAPAELKLAHLRRQRAFRHIVGWHFSWSGDRMMRPKGLVGPKGGPDDWKPFFDTPKPPRLEYDHLDVAGVSMSLREVRTGPLFTWKCANPRPPA